MYTSIVDILEGLRSNHPVNLLHIVQVLLDLLANSDPVGMTVSIGQLINKVNREKARIVANVNAARSRDGAIRQRCGWNSRIS